MPYKEEWVPPELFMTHNGVNVFHAYKDGSFDDRLDYWYTLDAQDNGSNFDVRDLQVPSKDLIFRKAWQRDEIFGYPRIDRRIAFCRKWAAKILKGRKP